MSWFKKGNEALRALEEAEKKAQLMKERAVPRFWLKPGEEANIIFVDDEGFWCERHIVKLPAGRFQEITCKAGIGPCSLCLLGHRITHFTYFTVVDLRQYVKKDGSVVKYSKVLLPAKRTLAKQIFDFKQRFGSLVGLKATLKRYSATDPSCGIIVDFTRDAQGKPKKYNLLSLGPEYATPFDYTKILAPLSDEELKALGLAVNVVGSIPDIPLEEGTNLIEDLDTKDMVDEELPSLDEDIPPPTDEEIPDEFFNFEGDDDIGDFNDDEEDLGELNFEDVVEEETKPKKNTKKKK